MSLLVKPGSQKRRTLTSKLIKETQLRSSLPFWSLPPLPLHLFLPPSLSFLLFLFFLSTTSILYCCCCLVTKSCPTLCNPMDCSLLGSSVHEIFQARIPGWIGISFSRGSSWSRDQTCVSCNQWQILDLWDTRKALHSIYYLLKSPFRVLVHFMNSDTRD